jgi:molybdate transport system substrate-binding protein
MTDPVRFDRAHPGHRPGHGDHRVVLAAPLRWASALALAALAPLACSEPASNLRNASRSAGPESAGCGAEPVRMGVAASLREIALAIVHDLEDRAGGDPIAVELSLGASSALARQIELGAPIDVLVSADAGIVERLAARGRVEADSTVEIARGRLVLIAREDSPWVDRGLAALSSAEWQRIALPAPAVPLGRYARAWLEARDLLDPLRGRIVLTEHARATLAAVEQGHVDLAIVYASDARVGHGLRVLAELDPVDHPSIRYVAARSARARPCDEVDRVLRAWTGERARVRLDDAGFAPPEATADASGERTGSEVSGRRLDAAGDPERS